MWVVLVILEVSVLVEFEFVVIGGDKGVFSCVIGVGFKLVSCFLVEFSDKFFLNGIFILIVDFFGCFDFDGFLKFMNDVVFNDFLI